MGKNSAIEWTNHTFNPWLGCAHVSPGCANCYAEALMDKRMGRVQWGVNGTRQRTSEANWRQPLKWNREAAEAGVRRRVFCASLADVFEDRPELVSWRSDLFAMIDATPNLDWLLLTKRPENIKRLWPFGWYEDAGGPFTWPNVWIGTSVENQEQANKRIPHLLRIPARVRFLSMEPLLGPVNLLRIDYGAEPGQRIDCLREWYYYDDRLIDKAPSDDARTVSWVIVGGESGHSARPMHPEWARSIRDQCQVAGVPLFFKQWGGWVVSTYIPDPVSRCDYKDAMLITRTWATRTGNDISGDTTMMVRVGKHAAGRLLDGRMWNEFPEPYAVGNPNP